MVITLVNDHLAGHLTWIRRSGYINVIFINLKVVRKKKVRGCFLLKA